jgi:hypothetical protein
MANETQRKWLQGLKEHIEQMPVAEAYLWAIIAFLVFIVAPDVLWPR